MVINHKIDNRRHFLLLLIFCTTLTTFFGLIYLLNNKKKSKFSKLLILGKNEQSKQSKQGKQGIQQTIIINNRYLLFIRRCRIIFGVVQCRRIYIYLQRGMIKKNTEIDCNASIREHMEEA